MIAPICLMQIVGSTNIPIQAKTNGVVPLDMQLRRDWLTIHAMQFGLSFGKLVIADGTELIHTVATRPVRRAG